MVRISRLAWRVGLSVSEQVRCVHSEQGRGGGRTAVWQTGGSAAQPGVKGKGVRETGLRLARLTHGILFCSPSFSARSLSPPCSALLCHAYPAYYTYKALQCGQAETQQQWI